MGPSKAAPISHKSGPALSTRIGGSVVKLAHLMWKLRKSKSRRPSAAPRRDRTCQMQTCRHADLKSSHVDANLLTTPPTRRPPVRQKTWPRNARQNAKLWEKAVADRHGPAPGPNEAMCQPEVDPDAPPASQGQRCETLASRYNCHPQCCVPMWNTMLRRGRGGKETPHGCGTIRPNNIEEGLNETYGVTIQSMLAAHSPSEHMPHKPETTTTSSSPSSTCT